MIFRTAVEHAKKHPGEIEREREKLQGGNPYETLPELLDMLIPQFFFICLGMGGAGMYLIRLARGPHVTWNKTTNPEPWNKLDPTYQYKFVAIGTDYKNLKKEGPNF